MTAKNILIAESGSTKTDWCLLHGNTKRSFKTQGINPYFLLENEILSIFENELKIDRNKTAIDEIHFYGAGMNSSDKKKQIEKCLKIHFKIKNIHSYSDLVASARATCGHQKGISCILGTGSNSCYFDGKKMGFKTPALGFILGDEGGGTHLGKKILQYYLHDIFDKELKTKFESRYDFSKEIILENLYQKPLANRYLASFASFVFENRGHYMIENIAEDCLNDFFIHHLIRYPNIHKMPVHFSGSVAFFLKDIIKNLTEQYDIQLGVIIQKPMKGLIAFHSN